MPADLRTVMVQAKLMFLRREVLYVGSSLRSLARRNAFSRSSVVAARGPIVSLTTYGERFRTVHLTLESIAAGHILPSRLILWLDDVAAFSSPTLELRRLIDRGLEIKLAENYGPHTKYFPYLLSQSQFEVPLVTADDDLLYSPWWLAQLVEAHCLFPNAVNCFRAHKVVLDAEGIAPYLRWEPCLTSEPSLTHFGTGVSGCIYPVHLLQILKEAGTEFFASCPRADDVWLHVHALRMHMPVRQIRDRSLRFPLIPGTQTAGLWRDNVANSGNDQQIRWTYTAADIALLRAAGATMISG